jgi:hypothetical protein
MNWLERNAHEDTTRDRIFHVILRPHQDGEQRGIAVKLEAYELFGLAQHGPLVLQANAVAIHRARAILDFQNRGQKIVPLGGFQWWGDPIIQELH